MKKAKPLLAEYKEKQIQKVSVLKEIVLNIMYVWCNHIAEYFVKTITKNLIRNRKLLVPKQYS